LDQQPKILIVTEKLLTGFDAPVLYAMYLDKPLRDHTLLQAIARVNRPYENEAAGMVKPHGFVMDFIGIFDMLQRPWRSTSTRFEICARLSCKGPLHYGCKRRVPWCPRSLCGGLNKSFRGTRLTWTSVAGFAH